MHGFSCFRTNQAGMASGAAGGTGRQRWQLWGANGHQQQLAAPLGLALALLCSQTLRTQEVFAAGMKYAECSCPLTEGAIKPHLAAVSI